jgi:DegV family protein with EDD domain
MEKIKIITDSTASIPSSILAQYPEIGIVPLYIQFGDQSYKEGVDITHADFFTKLAAASQLPTTSQPSAGDFVEAYKPWLDQGYAILSAHIGTKLSGTVASALAAKQILNGDIEVLDSESAGMCLGFVAIEGARALRAGKSKAEILARMNAVKDGVRVMFAVDTLEYLKKGGRIGGAQALLGSILQIKPILIIRDGKIDVLEKIRTSKKARQRLMDIAGEVQQRYPKAQLKLAVHEADAFQLGQQIVEELRQRFAPAEIHLSTLSAALSVHTGPGLIGLVIWAEENGTVYPAYGGPVTGS